MARALGPWTRRVTSLAPAAHQRTLYVHRPCAQGISGDLGRFSCSMIHTRTGLRAFHAVSPEKPSDKSTCEAVSTRVKRCISQAEQLKEGGSLEDAKRLLKLSIEDEESLSGCLEITALHNRYGRLLLLEGHVDEAMAVFEKAYAICDIKEAKDQENPFWAATIQSLGLAHMERREFDQAEERLRSAAAAIEKCYGENSEALLKARKQLCLVLKETNNWEEYLNMHMIILNQIKRMNNGDPRLTLDEATISYNVAAMMQQNGEYDGSNVMLERAMDLMKSLGKSNKDVKFKLAFCYELQGILLEKQRDWEGARKSYTKSKKLFHSGMGSEEFGESLYTANLLRLLGSLDVDHGRFSSGLASLMDAYKIMSAHPKPDLVSFQLLRCRLAEALYVDGQLDLALEVLLPLVTSMQRAKRLIPIWSSIAMICFDLGRITEAYDSINTALELCEEFDNIHDDTLLTLKRTISGIRRKMISRKLISSEDEDVKLNEYFSRFDRIWESKNKR